MGGKCLCITILSILWLPFFVLFLLSGFFAAFNQIYEVVLTDEMKGRLSGVIKDVPVPTKADVTRAAALGNPNFVGVGPAPMVIEDYFPGFVSSSVKIEVVISWKEAVWFGLVAAKEKLAKGCGAIDRQSNNPCTDRTMTYLYGGPETAETKEMAWEILPGSYYIAGGAPQGGGDDDDGEIDVHYKVVPTVMGGIQVLCVIACIVCGLFLISPCILCCVWKTKKDGGATHG